MTFTSTTKSGATEPLTVEKLLETVRRFRADFPPLPRVSFSPHATMLPAISEPFTDDMRAMADDLRLRNPPDREPAVLRIGNDYVLHSSFREKFGS